MRALFVWPDCTSFARKDCDYYFLECSIDEIRRGDCGPRLQATDTGMLQAHLSRNNEWTKINPHLATVDALYFLVSDDASDTILEPVYFPYSGLWNAYSPLLPLGNVPLKHINDLRTMTFARE